MDWEAGVTVLIFGLTLAIFGFWLGNEGGQEQIMRQAFERGYAVKCLGKEGYFWECEE